MTVNKETPMQNDTSDKSKPTNSKPRVNPGPVREPENETPVAEVAEFLVTFMKRVMDLKPEWERYERELIDQSFGEPSANRLRAIEDHAATTWDRLQSDGGVVAQADYALLRSGLGRRVRPDGPPVDLALHFEWDKQSLWVQGSQLLGSIGLVFRWGDLWQHYDLLAFSQKAVRHIVPLELLEREAVQVIAFDSSSVTGFAVLSPVVIATATGA